MTGRRNAPGLANVGWLPRLTFADPGATSLEAQVLIPLVGEHSVEMGMKGWEAELGRRLDKDRCYRKMFALAFPERGRVDIDSVAAALAAFQRTMTSYASPFDKYLVGDRTALTSLQIEGERLFRVSGCAACHAGPLLTDAEYHRFEESGADKGLAEKTAVALDRGKFRTPSLPQRRGDRPLVA